MHLGTWGSLEIQVGFFVGFLEDEQGGPEWEERSGPKAWRVKGPRCVEYSFFEGQNLVLTKWLSYLKLNTYIILG